MLLFFCCSAPSLNRYHIFEMSIWVYYHGQHACGAIFHVFFFLLFFFPARAARFMIIPLWHRRPGTAPLTPAIWLSHTTLGYTVAHSAIDWGVEGQLFNTSEQQVLLSSWLFSCLIFAPPKNVSCLLNSCSLAAGICPALTTHAFNAITTDTEDCGVGLHKLSAHGRSLI